MNNTLALLVLLTLTASAGAASNSAPTAPSPESSAGLKSRTTQVPTDASRQAKVDTLLTVSGIAAQLDMLTNEMVAQFAGPPAQDSKVSDAKVKMEALAKKAFPAGRLIQVARENLLTHYDATIYDRYIAAMNEPLAKRFTAMEAVQIKPGALNEYLKELQANPMVTSRIKLIEAIDEAGHTSQQRIELVTSIAETMAVASLGACPSKEQVAQVKSEMSKMRDPIRQQHQANARITLAYIYRSATDAELASLLKIMREGGHQNVSKWVWDATQREMKAGFAVMAEAVSAIAAAANKQKTVFAQRSCDGKSLLPAPGYAKSPFSSAAVAGSPKVTGEGLARQAQATSPAKEKVVAVARADLSVKETATSAVEVEQAPKATKPWRRRANMDARECLEYEDMKKVMACAERFR